jgi:copper(I)-binding protein
VTGGSSPAATRVELHETVKNDAGVMQMQPKQGGLTIPAGGTHVLQPGGDHVMLLGLTTALASGTTTTVTLSTSDGDVVLTVPVRSFPGAEESYVPTPSPS